ncbi:hypothetical protein BB560_003878 [Smittium megazygosporum]|uniref:DOC domain-containing protein n=1 Tax=Smittium megazygosporum TaxID=133381 RepID=A0A2T9Z8E0_9FUNG|nr:hypothetical protein BB560_004809 [Smittium megazygosporum]PVV01691.1 hypothetical protein BB560_003878 [Smittium megazygosporum]
MDPESVDISSFAFWSVSSNRGGYPLSNMRDSDPDTYWQSQGETPHFITAEFLNPVKISEISIHIDYEKDDSFTPEKFVILSGNNLTNLQRLMEVSLDKPSGIILIKIEAQNNPYLEASIIQIFIVANCSGGNDSRIRNISIHGPPIE